jgi:hypothetical protein
VASSAGARHSENSTDLEVTDVIGVKKRFRLAELASDRAIPPGSTVSGCTLRTGFFKKPCVEKCRKRAP